MLKKAVVSVFNCFRMMALDVSRFFSKYARKSIFSLVLSKNPNWSFTRPDNGCNGWPRLSLPFPDHNLKALKRRSCAVNLNYDTAPLSVFSVGEWSDAAVCFEAFIFLGNRGFVADWFAGRPMRLCRNFWWKNKEQTGRCQLNQLKPNVNLRFREGGGWCAFAG